MAAKAPRTAHVFVDSSTLAKLSSSATSALSELASAIIMVTDGAGTSRRAKKG